jgi:hypothetical protein
MTANVIPTFQTEQFATTVKLLTQQTQSRLSGYVTMGSYVGKQASPVDQIGSVEMLPVTSRFQPMGRVDAPTDRRWVFPSDFELPQLVDSFDQLRLMVDPRSTLVQAAVAAANRKKDAVIAAAFFADAKTGESGATTTSFPTSTSTNVVGVNTGGTASNLNVAKLRAAKKLLMSQEVGVEQDEELYCAITATEHDALLNEIQIINQDYRKNSDAAGTAVLEDGRVRRFLGINFVIYNGLTTATDDQSGTSRQIPVWSPTGVHLGMWQDLQVSVTQRNDLAGMPWQVYTKLTLGATRIEEKRVVKIWCR